MIKLSNPSIKVFEQVFTLTQGNSNWGRENLTVTHNLNDIRPLVYVDIRTSGNVWKNLEDRFYEGSTTDRGFAIEFLDANQLVVHIMRHDHIWNDTGANMVAVRVVAQNLFKE